MAINLLPDFKKYTNNILEDLKERYKGVSRSISIISFENESAGSNTYVNGIKKYANLFGVNVKERSLLCNRRRK